MPTIKDEVASLIMELQSRVEAIVDLARKEALSRVR